MQFSTPFAAVLAISSYFTPAIALNQVPAGFQYMNSADDGEMYFVKPMAQSGDVIFTQIMSIEPDGKQQAWSQQFNCANNTTQASSSEWFSAEPNTVGEGWFEVVCK